MIRREHVATPPGRQPLGVVITAWVQDTSGHLTAVVTGSGSVHVLHVENHTIVVVYFEGSSSSTGGVLDALEALSSWSRKSRVSGAISAPASGDLAVGVVAASPLPSPLPVYNETIVTDVRTGTTATSLFPTCALSLGVQAR